MSDKLLTQVPEYTCDESWARKSDAAAMAAFNASGAPSGKGKSSPQMTRSSGTSYDGTTDPGAPGEPV